MGLLSKRTGTKGGDGYNIEMPPFVAGASNPRPARIMGNLPVQRDHAMGGVGMVLWLAGQDDGHARVEAAEIFQRLFQRPFSMTANRQCSIPKLYRPCQFILLGLLRLGAVMPLFASLGDGFCRGDAGQIFRPVDRAYVTA